MLVYIVYFIVVPIIVVLLLVFDLTHFVGRRQLMFVNHAWYFLLLVFAILSILSFLIMHNSLSEHHVYGHLPEFWGEVQPPASLKGLDIPSRRAVFVPWKPSRRPVFGMGNPTFR